MIKKRRDTGQVDILSCNTTWLLFHVMHTRVSISAGNILKVTQLPSAFVEGLEVEQ